MTTDVKNLEASVRARLQNKAKETGRSFSEMLQYFVERNPGRWLVSK